MTKNSQYHARLEHMKAQLERHGYSAEVVVRTTPEATDMMNFVRLWEFVIVTADRTTRGYMSKSSRKDFDQTRDDFGACMAFMIEKLQENVDRHDIDLTGNNFISRIAQRYKIAKRKPRKKSAENQGSEQKAAPKAAQKSAAVEAEKAAAPKAAPKAAAAEKPAAKKAPAKKAAPAKAAPEASSALEEVEGL